MSATTVGNQKGLGSKGLGWERQKTSIGQPINLVTPIYFFIGRQAFSVLWSLFVGSWNWALTDCSSLSPDTVLLDVFNGKSLLGVKDYLVRLNNLWATTHIQVSLLIS